MKYEVELIRLNGFMKGGKPCLGYCPLDTFRLDSYFQANDFGRSKIGRVRYIPRFWGAEYDYAPYYALYVGYRIKSEGKTQKEVCSDELIEKLRGIKFYVRMIEDRDKKLTKLLGYTW